MHTDTPDNPSESGPKRKIQVSPMVDPCIHTLATSAVDWNLRYCTPSEMIQLLRLDPPG